MIDNWQERELHCEWYGHTPSHVLWREPIYRPVSPEIKPPTGEPQSIPHVEIRQCEVCKREFRTPTNIAREK